MIKSNFKRTAAIVAAVCVTVSSMASCSSSTDYSITANDTKINAGVYINYILNEMSNQMYSMYYSGEITDPAECLDKDIDGKDFKTYVKDKALESTREFAAIQAKFDELGLKLSDEDAQAVKDSVSSAWSSQGDYYEYEGISKESLTQCNELSYKRTAIFNSMYGEGGTDEVTADELQNFVNENYIRYKIINISKSSETDEEAAKAENEEAKALWEEYLEKGKDLDFASFDTLIDEYSEYQAQKQAEEEAAESETADTSSDASVTVDDEDLELNIEDLGENTDESAADDTAGSAEDTEESTADSTEETAVSGEMEEAQADAPQADTESEDVAADESVAESEADESESSDGSVEESDTDDSTAEDESADTDTESTDETEEETDPYVNERVINYTDNTNKDDEYYDEEFAATLTAVKEAEVGKVSSYENDSYYIIFVSAPISERTEYVDENKDSLLQEIKGDEFDELVKSWVEAMSIVVNDKAVKRYTVQEVYDRQEEYYSKEQA